MIAAEHLPLLRDPAVIDAIKRHAVAEYPKESCGAILPWGYVPLQNIHPDPQHYFNCSAQLEIFQRSRELVAVVHSHPDGPEGPSSLDQAQQRAMDVPWGLLICDANVAGEPFFWGDDLEPPPLENRLFRHGPSGTDGKGDCGALIRDWFRLNRGVIIKDYPRDDGWWFRGQNHYLGNYADAGFVEADPKLPEIGDLGLFSVGIQVPTANHAAIYVGDGLIIHHLAKRYSRTEPVMRWKRFIRAWLRYAPR